MQNSSFEVINLSFESATAESYDNHPIAKVNDHEVRISTMTEAYHWHCHPDSDESFLALEGGLYIDFDDRTVELAPWRTTRAHGCMSMAHSVSGRRRALSENT